VRVVETSKPSLERSSAGQIQIFLEPVQGRRLHQGYNGECGLGLKKIATMPICSAVSAIPVYHQHSNAFMFLHGNTESYRNSALVSDGCCQFHHLPPSSALAAVIVNRAPCQFRLEDPSSTHMTITLKRQLPRATSFNLSSSIEKEVQSIYTKITTRKFLVSSSLCSGRGPLVRMCTHCEIRRVVGVNLSPKPKDAPSILI